MEQRASSLQQRLEARRNMFLAAKTGDAGGVGSGPPSMGTSQPAYISSRTGKNETCSVRISFYAPRPRKKGHSLTN